jgi:hypothetical protein
MGMTTTDFKISLPLARKIGPFLNHWNQTGNGANPYGSLRLVMAYN